MKISSLLLTLLICAPTWASSGTVLIKSVMVVDGTSKPKYGPVDIEVIHGVIARIGPNLKSRATKIIAGQGKTVVPGLIDTHTHLHSVPGSVFRNETPQDVQRQQKAQLKAYLAAGVTTVLDNAAPESLFREAAQLDRKGVAPRILGLAPFLTPKDGYFATAESRGSLYRDLWPPIEKEDDIAIRFEQASQLKPLGAKVTVEKGLGPFDVWPSFSDEINKRIMAESTKYEIPLFVHSLSKEEHRAALRLRPYALVHAGFNTEAVDVKILQEIKDSGVYVMTTLAIYKMMLLMWQPEFLKDPWVNLLVPAEQLKTAANKKFNRQAIETVVMQNKPKWIAKSLVPSMAGLFLNETVVRKQLARSMKAVKAMDTVGIPLVMGSDAGNWPVWTTFFHGVGSVLEIEAMIEAGLSAQDVLMASTSRAARMLKLDKKIGTVATGMVADLVILSQDPLMYPKAFREVAYVMKGGVVKTPREWMQ
ncbi:MAG: amidohydrolase family protein [Bdellovibrionales bacterium]